MKFAYSYLKELVDITKTAEELAEVLSMHAFETEVVADKQTFENIIVARVIKIEKHPNADRLRIITLTDGRQNYTPVVCGAWNFDEGAIVPLALPGAVIPHNQHDTVGKSFTLSKATIRGIESAGMICSAMELGLGEDGGGILLLDTKYKIGDQFSVSTRSVATLLDISIPANRPDLLSYLGVAREIAALTGKKYKAPKSKLLSASSKPKSKLLKVRISDPKLCKRYLAVRLGNVKVSPSPKFIQDKLRLSGLRPINNIVDITNLVMLQTGQPLHAFDAAKIVGAINIRTAFINESLKTLDGVARSLKPDMLLIADSKKALAIAGLMGGLESAVTDTTTEIILEAATFEAISVRTTSNKLGLRTEASIRFEKSLPVTFTELAAQYALELLIKYASAQLLEYVNAGIQREIETVVNLDYQKVNDLLGMNVSVSQQKTILSRFGFQVADSKVKVPYWRPDVRIWQDLAEEIGRFVGLEIIPSTVAALPNSSSMTDPLVSVRELVADFLVGMGFDETYTYSFTSSSTKDSVEVANPLSEDQHFLRKGIGMNYKKIIEQNAEFIDEQNLFEIGNVFSKSGESILERTNLFMLASDKSKLPVEKLTSSLLELFNRLGMKGEVKQISEQSGSIFADGAEIGVITVSAEKQNKWAALELDFEQLASKMKTKQFEPFSRYPAVKIDVAAVVRDDLPWAELKKAIYDHGQALLRSVRLFDIYRGKNVSLGKKSLAFRIVYQAGDRTLKDEEVQKIHQQILNSLKSKFNVQIRE